MLLKVNIVFLVLEIVCLFMARTKKKSKFLVLFDQELESISKLSSKPKLCLQACCSPCSIAALELLSPYFQITLYYNGHNIYPYSEYQKRLVEMEKLVNIARRDFSATIDLVSIPPKINYYMQTLEIGANQREGGSRCSMCYGMRLKECLDFASNNGYDYVSTVMTMSRQKCSEKINDIAHLLMFKYPDLKYLYSDFKKRSGIDRSKQLCDEYSVYRQQYCGCAFSLYERMKSL